MGSEAAESVSDRLDRIVEMKAGAFCYRPMCEAIADELEGDEQFSDLLLLSEQARQLVGDRRSQVEHDDPIQATIAEFGDSLDKEIHRRADEVIAELCASLVRQDDRWIADNPDTVDTTEIQAALVAIYRASWWLNDHEEIVDRLEITYTEDE